jgi:subtilisin family serine protease
MNKLLLSVTLGTVLAASSAASAQDPLRSERLGAQALPAGIQGLKLDSPISMRGVGAAVLERSPLFVDGANQVLIRLASPSVSEQKVRGKSAQKAKKALRDEQSDLLAEVLALDPNARILGQTQLVLNAVFVEVDRSVLATLAGNPAVQRIVPVANYELDLSETVPYIGATDVQNDGFDGAGITVAVLDSGIDYTHANLGGGGTLADYQDAYGTDPSDPRNTTRDGLFPTAKVVEGYDFVGEVWPDGDLAPDPDPIDFEGHGTHVADIIGGLGGVAPGADLVGVKVCSAVSSSCSGVALIQGMEFAVDPDGDGDPIDRVDIINMSLGANYGQPFDDDLSAAVDNATGLGVLTVSSAGNGSDKPYITGTPSSAPTALAVAQTQVPSAALQLITVDGVDYPAVFQSWSMPLTSTVSGPVQYGDGAGGNLNGCAPFAGDLSGLIVLVDRGACNFTLKISNISQAGGAAGIIGLVAPGAPFSGGDGGDRPIDIPGFMINQADSNAIKAQIGGPGIGTIDPANLLPLVGQMVGSSSRGPQHESTTLIKPEIGAPGASVSAIAGSGTGEGPFGGTSGASPMVAGSAALLMQAQPWLSPLEAKAKLMNTGETNIDTDPFTGLAPITRIGGGEVRVDRAVSAPAAAWDDDGAQGALSFGFVDVEKDTVNLFKTVRVRNYSDSDLSYDVIPTFRYADDQDNGAVSVSVPKGKLKVKAGKDATFTVKMTINGALLRGNYMNSGSNGANPDVLTLNEYDGYLVLDDGEQPIQMAWHVLPRQASNVVARPVLDFTEGVDVVELTNNGVGTAQNDAYALLATSPNQPEGGLGQQSPTPDLRAVGINTFPVPAGFCSAQPSFIWAFSINTWERQQHLLPVSHQVELDTNQDGTVDYVVLNRDFSGPTTISDGRQLSWVLDVANGTLGAFFFAEHSMNTGNTVLLICGEQIGLTGTDMLATNVDMSVFAQDFYYGGPGDSILGLTVTPLGEQYVAVPEDIPGKAEGAMTVFDFGPFPGNTPELGVMLNTNGDRGAGARGGATQDTEALLIEAR